MRSLPVTGIRRWASASDARIHELGRCVAACLLMSVILSCAAAPGNRLGEIRSRGFVNCGIWPHVPGFASQSDGRYIGFEIDLCRAVAAAVFGDASRIRFFELSHVTQFAERKDVDLAVRRLTWTLSREAATDMVFGPIVFHDGQGFLVAKGGGVESVSQLAGERICVINMERHPATLYQHFLDSGHEIETILVENDDAAEDALRTGRCRAYSADVSWLAAARSGFEDGLTLYEILTDRISKEPLAPLMRAEDTDLAQLVRWTIFTMIEAEELGLSARTIDSAEQGSSRVRAFLNIHPGVRVVLGPGAWVRGVVGEVGNYGEVFERNLGGDSAIGLDRGLNRLWSQGGLMYAPPLDR
jgi:general L-amino acid transport system substrate-binding protein